MTEDQAFDYLYDRAALHGLTVPELLSVTPTSVSDCYMESAEFWDGKDISHICPQSTHPHLASEVTNVMPEDPSPNRARGAQVMTEAEIEIAHADNTADAEIINVDGDFMGPVDDMLFAFI